MNLWQSRCESLFITERLCAYVQDRTATSCWITKPIHSKSVTFITCHIGSIDGSVKIMVVICVTLTTINFSACWIVQWMSTAPVSTKKCLSWNINMHHPVTQSSNMTNHISHVLIHVLHHLLEYNRWLILLMWTVVTAVTFPPQPSGSVQ